MSLLLTVAGTPGLPDEVAAVNDHRFVIPINVEPARRHEIKAMELWVSNNSGRSWSKAGAATPEQGSFPFRAEADGLYWFSVKVIDQKNQADPRELNASTVAQKVLVDTLRPEVSLRSDRKGDAITVRWEIREEYPDLETMRVEYRIEGGNNTWVPITTSRVPSGQVSFASSSAVVVRLQIKDAAGNVGLAETKVPGGEVRTASLEVPSSPGLPPVLPVPGGLVPPPATTPVPAPGVLSSVPPPSSLPVVPSPEVKPAVEAVSTPPAPVPSPETSGVRSVATPPTPRTDTRPSTTRNDGVPATPPAPETDHGVVAHAASGGGVPASPGTSEASSDKESPIQIVNNRRITMEYEVAKVGPSGVGSVDLYVTRDNGMTWKRVDGEHGVSNAVAGGSSEVRRSTLSVDLSEDGVYGFHLVVKSGAGLGKQPPRTGDAPQMRVELDTSLPDAKLFQPQPSTTEKDTLVLNWKASDNRLGTNPVTLQWAERKEGPWEFVGAPQLPNTGSHAWRITRAIPARVYLRLTVKDAAGNSAIAETDSPILVDMRQPEGRILGLIRQ